MSQRRVRAGVPAGGQFAEADHAEAAVSLNAKPTGLEHQSPQEIDRQLADLYRKQMIVNARHRQTIDTLHTVVHDQRVYGRGRASWSMSDAEAIVKAEQIRGGTGFDADQAERYLGKLDEHSSEMEDLRAQESILDDEYVKRGRWARAFLVNNAGGHVHSSMSCSTCNRDGVSTDFQWMTDYSGSDEKTIVADAGWRACTVCYPSAPLGDEMTLPTKMFGDKEKAERAARDERERRKADLAADRIAKGLTADGSPFVVSYVERDAPGWERLSDGRRVNVTRDRDRHETFKTERAAVQWMVDEQVWGWRGLEDKRPAFDAIIDAMASKHDKDRADVVAEIEKKVAAKRKREGR